MGKSSSADAAANATTARSPTGDTVGKSAMIFAGLAFQDAAQPADGRGAWASRRFHGWNITK
jgi:hypothetical protein